MSEVLTQEAVDYAVARDERLKAVQVMIELEAAQHEGTAFRVAIDALRREEQIALESLMDCNPSDYGSVAAFQAQARVTRVIRDYLQAILQRGRDAEVSLLEEAKFRD